MTDNNQFTICLNLPDDWKAMQKYAPDKLVALLQHAASNMIRGTFDPPPSRLPTPSEALASVTAEELAYINAPRRPGSELYAEQRADMKRKERHG